MLALAKVAFATSHRNYFSPSEPSVLIKVAYNILEHSILDRANPVQAFLWRIVAGIYASRELEFTVAHVPWFLDTTCITIPVPYDFADVAKFASEFLPNDQHWILAVDELILLVEATREQIGQMPCPSAPIGCVCPLLRARFAVRCSLRLCPSYSIS